MKNAEARSPLARRANVLTRPGAALRTSLLAACLLVHGGCAYYTAGVYMARRSISGAARAERAASISRGW